MYGAMVATGGGYFFVAGEGNIYVYNARTRVLVATMAGYTIAVGSGYIAIGDPGYYPSGSTASGKVDIYSVSNLRRPIATITQPNTDYQGFGTSIAISGSQMLVSDLGTNSGDYAWSGDVYVYSIPSFNYVTKLTQQNPEYAPGATFGTSVAFCGNHIIVGAPGETVNGVLWAGNVYLYDADTYAWERTIPNPDASGGFFGWSIAVVGDNIWIGEPFYSYPGTGLDDGILWAGKVYCYNPEGTQIITLNTPNPVFYGFFGRSIAANDNYVIVGAPGESVDVTIGTDTTTLTAAGNAYLFTASGEYVKTLASLNPKTEGHFGNSVAIDGHYLVGAPDEDVTVRYRSTMQTYEDAGHAYMLS